MITYRELPAESSSGQTAVPPQPAETPPARYGGENHIFYQKASSGSGMSLSSILLAAGLGVQLHVVASKLSSRRQEENAKDREP